MPEDVTDKLTKFTPTGLDRDAVLFAAGKTAGRGSRVWKWLAAALAVSNAVTLTVFLWPRMPTAPTPTVPTSNSAPLPIVMPSGNLSADDLPPLAAADGLVPDGPLLTAGSLDAFFRTLTRDTPWPVPPRP